MNPSDSKAGGHFGIYHFWITHHPNFRPNMMFHRLLFSIGPPSLPSFKSWDKKGFLDSINISRHQRQQNRRPRQNFIITHNHNCRANMMHKILFFFDRPPNLPSFICWEKKAFLFPINISEQKGQQSRRLL